MARSEEVEKLAPSIGHMTNEWNDAQSFVFLIFHALLGSSILKAIAIFFAIKSDSGQRDVTLGLAKQVLQFHPDALQKLTAVLGDLNKTAGRRNDFIHTIWHFAEDEGVIEAWLGVRARLVGKDPAVELENLREEIGKIQGQLGPLLERIRQVVAPPPAPPQNALAGLALGWPPLSGGPAATPEAHNNPDAPAVPPLHPRSSEE